MNEGDSSVVGAASGTAGQLLRAAREAQGLHIAALAVSLKVPVKKLELLEADRLDELPDAVFARGLASSMCRALKVDPTDILGKLPQTNKPLLGRAEQRINAPFRMPNDGPAPSPLTALSKPAVLVVAALLIGALVLVFMPDFSSKTADAANSALSGLKSLPGALEGNGSGTAMGSGAVLTNDGGMKSATANAGGEPQTTLALSPSLTVSPSTPTVASPTLVVSAAMTAAAGTSTVADTDGLVVFRAKGESWVEVIDANGRITMRRLLVAGEAAAANGAVPLRVTVGRADQTSVVVRGKPFDGENMVRDNVLRFEVR
jgi:cytoskeleton protein RodZ